MLFDETIGIPFTEDAHSIILREAKRKEVQPETMLKIWILERVRSEVGIKEEQTRDVVDALSLPFKVGYILTASAATINSLADQISG